AGNPIIWMWTRRSTGCWPAVSNSNSGATPADTAGPRGSLFVSGRIGQTNHESGKPSDSTRKSEKRPIEPFMSDFDGLIPRSGNHIHRARASLVAAGYRRLDAHLRPPCTRSGTAATGAVVGGCRHMHPGGDPAGRRTAGAAAAVVPPAGADHRRTRHRRGGFRVRH